MFKNAIKALLALSLLFGSAQANDSMFGGQGATLLPIKNNKIAMVDEHVILNGVPDTEDPDWLRGWKVSCTFHFKNTTSKEQKIKMGFPFPRWRDFSEEMIKDHYVGEDPDKEKKLAQPAVMNFTASVRGARVETQEIEIKERNSPFGQAWIWEVTFAPGETVEVVNTYEHGVTASGDIQFIEYVLRTGKNWKGGKIGRSLLELRPNMRFIEAPPGVITTHWPDGYTFEPDGKFKKVVWDLKNFAPSSDLYFAFITARDANPGDYHHIFDHILEQKSCAELRIVRNAFYAEHNYPFKDPELRKYYAEHLYDYEPNPKFNLKKLSPYDRDALLRQVRVVREMEKKKGCIK